MVKRKKKAPVLSVPVRVLPYDEVRSDLTRMALPVVVASSAIDKKGPVYDGYADVAGTLRPFKLSGLGFELLPAASDQDAARFAYQALLDKEDAATTSRRRGS